MKVLLCVLEIERGAGLSYAVLEPCCLGRKGSDLILRSQDPTQDIPEAAFKVQHKDVSFSAGAASTSQCDPSLLCAKLPRIGREGCGREARGPWEPRPCAAVCDVLRAWPVCVRSLASASDLPRGHPCKQGQFLHRRACTECCSVVKHLLRCIGRVGLLILA